MLVGCCNSDVIVIFLFLYFLLTIWCFSVLTLKFVFIQKLLLLTISKYCSWNFWFYCYFYSQFNLSILELYWSVTFIIVIRVSWSLMNITSLNTWRCGDDVIYSIHRVQWGRMAITGVLRNVRSLPMLVRVRARPRVRCSHFHTRDWLCDVFWYTLMCMLSVLY